MIFYKILHHSQEKPQVLQRLKNKIIINFIVNFPKTVPGETKVSGGFYSYKRDEVEEKKTEK